MSDNDTGSSVATKEKSEGAAAETEATVQDSEATPATVVLDKPAAAKVQPAEPAEPPTGADALPPTAGKFSRLPLVIRILVPLVSLIAIVALVAAGVLGWKLKQERDIDAAGEAGLAAARTYAVTLTSVDSSKLDGDFAAVLDGSTGEFRDMYTRSSGQLRQLLLENKATGKGTVLDAAIKSATETKVEVLLFIDQTVTNSASADPRVDRSRVVMTMELVDGRWLASRVYLP